MELAAILDFEATKLLEIITLLQHQREGLSVEQLSETLQVDRKTVKRYIKKLQALMYHYRFDQSIRLTVQAKQNVQIECSQDRHLLAFHAAFLREQPEIVILQAIIETSTLNMDALTKRLSVSESNIRKRIKKVNEWLEQFQLCLKRKTYALEGEESQIREFIFQFYWSIGLTLEMLEEEPEKLIQTLFEVSKDYFQLQFNDNQIAKWLMRLYVTVQRQKQGYLVQLSPEWLRYMEKSHLFYAFSRQVSECLPQYHFVKEELMYIFLLCQATLSEYFSATVQMHMVNEHHIFLTSSFRLTFQVTSALKSEFWEKNIAYNQQIVIRLLGFHLYYALFAHFSYEQVYVSSFELAQYPKFMKKVKHAISYLQQQHSFFHRIPQTSLELRYFFILSALISPCLFENPYYICILTDLPTDAETYLVHKINHYFAHRFSVSVSCVHRLFYAPYADMIISNTCCHTYVEPNITHVSLLNLTSISQLLIRIEQEIQKTCVM